VLRTTVMLARTDTNSIIITALEACTQYITSRANISVQVQSDEYV